MFQVQNEQVLVQALGGEVPVEGIHQDVDLRLDVRWKGIGRLGHGPRILNSASLWLSRTPSLPMM